MIRFFSILFLCLGASMFAQETGSIAGSLVDKDNNNEPLPFANVILKGSTKGTTTDFDGNYIIDNIPVGTYVVEFSFVGYETLEVPNVVVEANKVTNINTGLGASAAALDEVIIKTTVRRESEVALLLDQKKAVTIKQSIGAQEISRKGVSDAEGAVEKVSGISKSDGVKNVFVRGLGDRFNSTSLNGLPLPSEDPEYKNIALDFFTTDVIESIGVNKVFNSSIYGDAAGANIDVVSKSLTGKDNFKISVGTGYNTNTVGSTFLVPSGTNRLGSELATDAIPIVDLRAYSFGNSYDTDEASNPFNLDASLTAGKRFDINDDTTLRLLFVGSIDSDYLFKEGTLASFNSEGGQGRRLSSTESEYSTSQIATLNTELTFGNDHKIGLNNGVIRKVTQETGEFIGEDSRVSDQTELEDFIRRQQTNNNNLFVNQVFGDFNVSEKIDLNLKGSYNFIRAYEPDRRVNSFVRRLEDGEDFFRTTTGSAGLNHRFYSTLEEDDLAASVTLDYKLGASADNEEDNNNILSLGADYRNTTRTFEFTQFSFQFDQQVQVDLNNVDAIFNQQNLEAGLFEIVTNRGRADAGSAALAPLFYEGDKDVIAGFAQATYDFNPKLTVSGGLRVENVNQTVAFDTNLLSSVNDPNTNDAMIEETFILPNVSAKYNFSENSIFRLAGSKTYILPQFKEVAPFLYEDVNFSSFGNPGLLVSDVYNLDLKYDYFFSSGELVSFTGFYKSIDNAINRIRVNSAANDLSYVNVPKASIAGIEVELRKNIFDTEINDTKSNDLQVGLNASYLYSTQDLEDVDTDNLTVRFTNTEDELEGASPILINSDLTYNYKNNDFRWTASAVANYFSDRIYSIGTAGNNNFVEEGRVTLDIINQVSLNKNLGLSFKVKNLLDPDYAITQEVNGEDLAISTYKRGVNISLGLSYQF